MGRYFGTDGIRGKANETLKLETAYKVGRFIGYYYKDKNEKGILIGKDTRLSSSMFESALAAGISASGNNAYLLGYCSTPSLAYLAQKDKYACGVMISASHNPFYDNGIKIFGNDGIKIHDEIESLIEDYIDSGEGIDFAVNENIGKIIDIKDSLTEYKNWLSDLYPLDLKGYKLLADLANGSNCVMAKDVLAKTNATVTYINDDFDGTNINNNCGSTHLDMLKEKIKAGNYDLGFAFDGDADRVLFVDHNGQLVDGDKIMYLLALNLKEEGKLNNNTLVTTVMSNIGLHKICKEKGINTKITAVGDKNVLDCMLDNEYDVGGEQSGHIILRRDSYFGDGLKTALAVLSVLKKLNVSLQDSVKEVKIYPQLLINQKVNDKNIVLNDEEINKVIKEVEEELGDSGRILVRPSGTEPLIRVMVEAESDELCEKHVMRVINLIKEKGYAK